MEWFEKVKGTVKKTADIAYEKSSQAVEITKINFKISEVESEIKKIYTELGMKTYKEYKNGSEISEELKTICNEIDKKIADVEIYKKQLEEIKEIKICKNCGEKNVCEANFCKKCGEKIDN